MVGQDKQTADRDQNPIVSCHNDKEALAFPLTAVAS